MKAILLAIGLAASSSSFAASFDCGKAGNAVEHLICADEELSAADEELSAAYKQAAAKVGNITLLQGEQRQWLSAVRDQCSDKTCLYKAYAQRISALAAEPAHQQEAAVANPSDGSGGDTAPAEQLAPADAEKVIAAPETVSAAPETPALQPAVTGAAPAADPSAAPVAAAPASSALSSTLALKLLGIFLLANAFLAMYLHKKSKLTIYADYTDAAITGFWPLAAIVVYFLLRFLEVPDALALRIAIGVFAVLFLLVVLATYRANGLSLYFVMALLAKLTIVGAYYAIMALIMMGSGSGKRKGERQSTYEARCRREAREAGAAMAATTTAFVIVSACLCRDDQFTPMGRYLSLRR